VVTHEISRAQRSRLIDSITALAERGEQLPQGAADKDFYAIFAPREGGGAPRGYLFEVRGADTGATLYCAHVRERDASGRGSLYYYTRHGLAPGRNSFFFVTSVSGEIVGEPRPYALFVRAPGSEILSVRKLDLSRWRIGLPLSIAFTEGDDRPEASLLDNASEVTGRYVSIEDVEAIVGDLPRSPLTTRQGADALAY
jgi:hypothetical protein